MPCYDSRDHASENDFDGPINPKSPWYRDNIIVRDEKLDKYARMLCGLCGALEALGIRIADPELKAWWEELKAFDEKEGRKP